jgi:hypothetical protein
VIFVLQSVNVEVMNVVQQAFITDDIEASKPVGTLCANFGMNYPVYNRFNIFKKNNMAPKCIPNVRTLHVYGSELHVFYLE